MHCDLPKGVHGWRALVAWLACFAFPYPASPALAAESDKLAPVTIAGRETFDVFAVPAGVQSGTALLNKLQVSVTVRGDQLRFSGWDFHAQIIRFDGVAGSPAHPGAFLAERLRPSDGVLLIGQADWQLTKNSRIEGGAWGYSAAQPGPAGDEAHDRGAYLSFEAPLRLLPRLAFWMRGGVANQRAQTIAGYLGGGLVQRGTFAGRPDDRLALAVAHAIIGTPGREALMLPNAETSVELTYQARISRRF